MAKISSIFKSRNKPKELLGCIVSVLQNGHELIHREIPIKKRGRLYLTGSPNGLFSLPYYPFNHRRTEFISFTKAGCNITVDYRWEGLATQKGEVKLLKLGERHRDDIILSRNDYATLTYEDLRILIKVVPLGRLATSPTVHTSKGYRDSFFKLLIPDLDALKIGSIGVLAASVIMGSFVIGLKSRYVPQKLDPFSIAPSYVLPFISAEHFRLAPETLQEDLSRKDIIRGVVTYYQELTSNLLGRSSSHKVISKETAERYKNLHREANDKISSTKSQQNNPARVAIPAIVGESLVGGMNRVIDKVELLHQSIEFNHKAKENGQALANAKPYDWLNYRQKEPKDPPKEAGTAAMGPKEPNLKLMYKEALDLADQAKKAQSKLPHEDKAITKRDVSVIGIAPDSKDVKFALKGSGLISDSNLEALTGIPYGAKYEKKKAPPPKVPVGDIEPHIVERFIRGNRYQLDLCYELALKRNERTTGTINWEWRIDPRGNTSNIRVSSSSIKDKKLEECIRRKISTWKFPRPRRGAVDIAYPIEFTPKRG